MKKEKYLDCFNKKQTKKYKKKGKASSISMEKFLREHCNLNNEDVIRALAMLSHQELKIVCQKLYNVRLITVPFEVASENNHQGNGDFITVRDVFNNEAPYVNPSKKRELEVLSETLNNDYDEAELYEEIVDLIENNLTIEETDISSVGTFNLPKVKQKRRNL